MKGREASEAAENASDAVYLDPKLWRKLPPEVGNRVLSYVPIHRLIDTLLCVDSRWAKLLRSPVFNQMFGHGNNINSSYGIVMVEDLKVPRLMGFEQESQRWLSFPKKLDGEMKKATFIFSNGSRDGLMLCESTRCKFRNRPPCHTEVGVWNPLLCSFKWLPKNPHFINKLDLNPYVDENLYSYTCETHYAVMVHEPSRTYRVFLLLYYHQFSIHYSVYDNTSGSWRTSKRMPDFHSQKIETWRRVASCDRYIFLQNFQYCRISFVPEYYIYWYDAEKDMWNQVFVSQILQELGFKADNLENPPFVEAPFVENFVILHKVLYMLIRTVHTNEERSGSGAEEGQDVCFLASMDLLTLGDVEFGGASSTRFKFEAFLPDGFHLRDQISKGYFNMYCYTMKGKGYIGLHSSESGHFLYYDVSKGDWSKHYQSLEVQGKSWQTGQHFFHFKPSFVVP